MARLAQVAILVALCAAVAVADKCIYAKDAVEIGEPCQLYQCRGFAYCSVRGVCEPRIAANEACEYDDNANDEDPCENGASCRGPKGAQICVKYALAGQACSSLSNVTIPTCAGNLYCDSTYEVCRGAIIHEYCVPHANVSVCTSSLNCTNNACQGILDGCYSDSECAAGRYCTSTSFIEPGTCVPFLQEGARCNTTHQCAGDMYCEYPNREVANAEDPASRIRYCTPRFSRGSGEFCNDNDICADPHFCYGQRCAAVRPTTCTSHNGCADNERCMCGTTEIDSGVGYCAPGVAGCYESQQPLRECLKANCNLDDLTGWWLSYEGSCARSRCAPELDAYFSACSGAERIIGGALFALVAAFVARFVASA